jgi:hypothetical protein
MLKHTQEKKQIENNIFLEVDKKFWQVIEKERSLFFLNKKERKGIEYECRTVKISVNN